MATFRSLILAASNLVQGNTLRTHLNNLKTGNGSGGDIFVGSGLTAEIDLEMTADVGVALSANLTGVELSANMGENLSANIEQDLS